MLLGWNIIKKKIENLRTFLSDVGISSDLRGWEYDRPPVKPARQLLLPVSELASRYCPAMRDIFLRRVLSIQPPKSFKMFRGMVYHLLISKILIEAKRIIYSSGLISGSDFYEKAIEKVQTLIDLTFDEALRRYGNISQEELEEVRRGSVKLSKYILIEAAYSINSALSRFPHINVDSMVSEAFPPVTELKVDGSLVGLSRELSVDIYSPVGAVVDIKTGEVREFHRYAAAGYALAIEAEKGIPIDLGVIIYVSTDLGDVPSFVHDVFIVDDELRREFLEIRDEAQLLVERGADPGKPAACPRYCPYYSYCNSDVG